MKRRAEAYRFVWNTYCDWYLELAKPLLLGTNEKAKASKHKLMVAWVRDEILKMLHPFMPFITEELWGVTSSRDSTLALAEWSDHHSQDDDIFKLYFSVENEKAEAEIGWVIDLISAIRSVRSEMNIPASVQFPLGIALGFIEGRPLLEWSDVIERWKDAILRLARLKAVDVIAHPGSVPGQINIPVREHTAILFVGSVIDLAAERARLAKEMAKCDADIARVEQKLGNADFLKRAPEEVVEGEREKRDEAMERKAKIAEALQRLQGAA